MDTIKIQKQQTLAIAHRGLSSLERENSLAAFIAAGQRSYFGIETDVRVTSDGIFVLMHDKNTARVSPDDLEIGDCTYEQLSSVRLFGYDGKTPRADLRIPRLSDYIAVCRRYEKKAILELKCNFTIEELQKIIDEFKEQDYLDHVIFISFGLDNLLNIRKLLPDVPAQYLRSETDDAHALINRMVEEHLDLDVSYTMITREFVDECHAAGVLVNVWTVDNPETAAHMIECGVDFLTTNRLE